MGGGGASVRRCGGLMTPETHPPRLGRDESPPKFIPSKEGWWLQPPDPPGPSPPHKLWQPPTPNTCTTPPGFTPIMTQMPRKAESFSSLSRMLRRDVHLEKRGGGVQHQPPPPLIVGGGSGYIETHPPKIKPLPCSHQGRMNCWSMGATSCGQTKPRRPMVMAGGGTEKGFVGWLGGGSPQQRATPPMTPPCPHPCSPGGFWGCWGG